MRAVRSIVIVEAFPGSQLLLEIDVVAIREQLVELLLVSSMRPFDLAVELRSAWPDVDVLHAQVCDMPMKERLELVAAVGLDRADPKRKLVDHVIDEVDGVGLGVAAIHLERAYAGGVVDGRVLVAPHGPALFPFQSQELDVHLDAVTGNSLFVSVGVNRPAAPSIGEPVQSVPLAHAIHGCVRGLDVVVAL